MDGAELVVRRFCEAASSRDVERMAALLAEDVVYHNMPMDPVVGLAATVELLHTFMDGCDEVSFGIRGLAAAGHLVLTERVDSFAIGDRRLDLPVMGAFEEDGGRIRAWRDYFDLAPVLGFFAPG
ncbi:MAG: nuclear transport factor 2 family protein [Actinomycetota bacterium]|jgi:limonene-1,2-epoxide hydrolase|nr:nuclear transport factor 2 family protein [Actinomycetota bacterium]